MAYPRKSYADKLFIRVNRADLRGQGSCLHSDDSSRDELIFRGSYADNAIPAISFEKQLEGSRRRASAARDCGSRDAH